MKNHPAIRLCLAAAVAAPMLTALSALSGCTVGPDYKSPQMQLPATWAATQPATTEPATTQASAPEGTAQFTLPPATQPAEAPTTQPGDTLTRWWEGFRDPKLNQLVQQALLTNHDLRIAVSRIREARANLGITKADGLPSVGASGSYNRLHNSSNMGTPQPIDQNLYNAHFDASWEVDVFGSIRRNVEASKADLIAQEENRRDIQVSLLAEVAQNYIQARTAQRRTKIALRNIETQNQFLSITRAKAKAGLTSDLDVAQAEALLATTSSLLPSYENSRQQAIHRLGVLLGQAPAALEAELANPGPIPAAEYKDAGLGAPADLLRRRPDIRRAERELAASNARIGVATAELYPKFAITGLAGMQSVSFSQWFSADSHYYEIGPSITWRVFEGGRIREGINVANAVQEQAALGYEKSVLTAMEDVENALTSCQSESQRRAALADSVNANHRSVDLSGELYSKGLSNFLSVLDAQRSLQDSEDQLSVSESNMTLDLVALYKALGGGWDVREQ